MALSLDRLARSSHQPRYSSGGQSSNAVRGQPRAPVGARTTTFPGCSLRGGPMTAAGIGPVPFA